ncbi:TIGR02453 family protein [Leisingera daeponensis]|uniref:TIGR02453 family protein n=1 Tax=Leisingera daeponensis TaxID=405746 RepID=A0ABS7NC69_9RHOB|nr:TIGR02453 family protein [Leisingera daeponensis]MBY6138811.1 TIGR02453 family protein [Leisingera daeponensis]
MTDAFAQLIPDARAFLADLAENNSRDWFTAHNDRYDAQLKAPALRLMDEVAQAITRRHGTQVTGKLFRPQRDVRFSKDKTPYTTHLHMMWTLNGAGCALFFGIAPDYCTAGGGLMGFSNTQMPRWRQAIDGAFGDETAALVDILALKGFAVGEPELKRVPAPYSKAHPHGVLLQRKSLTFWHEMTPREQAAPMGALLSAYLTQEPMFALLDSALAE